MAAVIAVAGTRLTRVADRLADRTGLGEAFTGAVMLGAATSLPGVTASVTAAVDGLPSLSLANAIGGIAAQTTFLAVADLAYRKVNLEHAAASVPNMMQASLLVVLLAIMLCAMIAPAFSLAGLHPVSLVLVLVYVGGMRMVYQAPDDPMWRPRITPQTRVDVPAEPKGGGTTLRRLWIQFALAVVVVVIAGWLITRTAEVLTVRTGLTETLVGGLFIAVATSLPELVTSIGAVRRGALTLAVGGVIGGNAFDSLFAAVADVAYREGSLYHAATEREAWLVALTIVMTGVLLLGLLRRERVGIAGIGFESFSVMVIYALGLMVASIM